MECEKVAPDQPLRQGDIIAAQPLTDAWKDPWRRFGVILTADCDLAHLKSGPNLVYAPIISHYGFLALDWLPKVLESVKQKAKERLEQELAASIGTVTVDHMLIWQRDGGRELVAAKLTAFAGVHEADSTTEPTSRLLQMWDLLRDLERLDGGIVESWTTPADIICNVLDYRARVEGQAISRKSRCNLIENALLAAFRDRLDTCVISELLGLDPDMAEPRNFGFVATLRQFSVLPISLVETDRTRWYDKPDHYVRICRLSSDYRQDLVHRFANLFIRVGLDDFRGVQHRRLFKRCAESLFPEQHS